MMGSPAVRRLGGDTVTQQPPSVSDDDDSYYGIRSRLRQAEAALVTNTLDGLEAGVAEKQD